jgi:hypothetical protein
VTKPLSYAALLYRYRDKHGHLVEPTQGFHSLHEDLWLAYSMGRKRGFTDLGTYANKPGDHGYWPAWAFDLGRNNHFFYKGWNYLVARNMALFYWENHKALNIDYVILGRKLISRARPYWHPLTTGDTSHDFHIHVSGYHPEDKV